MKIATDFILNGKTVKDNDTYILTDNSYLKRSVVSSTLLHSKQSTRGHEHVGQEEVYIFIQGNGFMYLDEHQFPVKAGDVVTAAVILDPDKPITGLNDSKKLTAARRESLAVQIKEEALCWSIARASVEEIDALNILQASLLAMHRAVQLLVPQPTYVLVDGNHVSCRIDIALPLRRMSICAVTIPTHHYTMYLLTANLLPFHLQKASGAYLRGEGFVYQYSFVWKFGNI